MGLRQRVKAGAAPPPAPSPRSGYLGTGYASPWSDNSNLIDITFDELFGPTEDTLNRGVSRDEAMSLGVVARARNVVAPTIARLPLPAQDTAGPRNESAFDFLRQPENDPSWIRPGFVTYLWTVDAMMFYGRAWWWVTQRYADTRAPRSFRWVPEWDARLINGRLVGLLSDDSVHISDADTVRIDAPHEGVLNYARRELNMARSLDRSAAYTADNPVPAINLQEQPGVGPAHRLTESETDNLVSKWRAARRAGKVVSYTPASVKPEVLGLNVEQLLIEGRKYSALQVTRAMNVPAWVTDVALEGSSITYANVASRSRELVDFGLMPYLSAIEARLSADDVLPRGVWCRYDLTELLRGDFGQRMADYKAALDAGVYTLEQLQQMEHGPAYVAEPAPPPES
jgi:hypothetical protein